MIALGCTVYVGNYAVRACNTKPMCIAMPYRIIIMVIGFPMTGFPFYLLSPIERDRILVTSGMVFDGKRYFRL